MGRWATEKPLYAPYNSYKRCGCANYRLLFANTQGEGKGGHRIDRGKLQLQNALVGDITANQH